MKRIKWDGHYVKKCDYEYLIKCDKQESLFEDDIAEGIEKQCPSRVEIENINSYKMDEIEQGKNLIDEFFDTVFKL